MNAPLRQYVRSHRETMHLTRSRANVRRLRAAHAEIEKYSRLPVDTRGHYPRPLANVVRA